MKGRYDERGSVTVWGVLIAAVLVLVIGITVDLTGQVNAQQRAHDLAQQAGRAAANQVQAAQVMHGQSPQINTTAARTAALNYLHAAGVNGSVQITGPTTLSVHVTILYQPKFLGTAGIGPKTVSGDATIQLSRVVNGAPR
ncbi:MAG: TadE/TadG family type IV pilus assembly protein [Propionibacteriaceae bacterium]